jgi:hypothetical protein
MVSFSVVLSYLRHDFRRCYGELRRAEDDEDELHG